MAMRPEEKKHASHDLEKSHELVLLNDEVNSFEYVIDNLVTHCGHEPERAEQCAIIAHHNGECDVLLGTPEEVSMPASKLINAGLTIDVRKLDK
ncbi:MAG: ATP-dependent Clp protease adaptor ClpS [Vicingaceae bacterium]